MMIWKNYAYLNNRTSLVHLDVLQQIIEKD
jgi:hypothetical protein